MTQQPHPTIPELKLAQELGATRGLLDGQREAISRVESIAYLEAYHGQMKAAGLCNCEEVAAAQASPTIADSLTDLRTIADRVGEFVAELARIAGGLQPRPAAGDTVELVHVVASPELSSELNGILEGLAERTRARKAGAEGAESVDVASGRQVDADDTPTVPAQAALDIDPVEKLAEGGIVTRGAIDVDALLKGGVA